MPKVGAEVELQTLAEVKHHFKIKKKIVLKANFISQDNNRVLFAKQLTVRQAGREGDSVSSMLKTTG